MKFLPINLYSKPIQEQYELMLDNQAYLNMTISMLEDNTEELKRKREYLQKNIDDYRYMYYIRTGKIL